MQLYYCNNPDHICKLIQDVKNIMLFKFRILLCFIFSLTKLFSLYTMYTVKSLHLLSEVGAIQIDVWLIKLIKIFKCIFCFKCTACLVLYHHWHIHIWHTIHTYSNSITLKAQTYNHQQLGHTRLGTVSLNECKFSLRNPFPNLCDTEICNHRHAMYAAHFYFQYHKVLST